MNTKLIVRLLGYLLALSGVFVYAQEDPRMWDTDGVILRQGDHMEWREANAVNEFDQTCVAWCDARDGYWDIYAQVIAPDGRRLWPERGLLVCGAEWRQEDPMVVAVNDGWIFAWIDWRYGDRYQWGLPGPHAAVFAQKVSRTGEILWAADAVEVCDIGDWTINDSSIRLTDDRAGGAIIGWRGYEYNQGYYNYFRVQRINSTGFLEWNDPVMVTDQLTWGSPVQTVSDEEGNMLAVWIAEVDSATRNIFGAKITPDGALPWGDGLNGILLQAPQGMCYNLQICRDESANGFYTVWDVHETGFYTYSYYAQRFDENGGATWTDAGILLFNSADRVIYIDIAPSFDLDAQDGILIAGRRLMESETSVVGQKIDLNGNIWWGENGVDICVMDNYFWDATDIRSDLEGGAIALWDQNLNIAETSEQFSLLRAARIDNVGNSLWGDGGVTVNRTSMDWRYHGLISCVESSDVTRILYMDKDFLGFKSISSANGSQISETAVRILPVLQGETSDMKAVALNNARAAVVWQDGRHSDASIYYQIVDTLGTSLLEPHGRLLVGPNSSDGSFYYSSTQLCSDENGGFFVAVTGRYNDVRPLILMHLDTNEHPVHVLTQNTISDSTYGYENHFVASDGSGGCYALWNQYIPDDASQVTLQRFSDQCEPQWPAPLHLFESDPYVTSECCLWETSDSCCVAIWYSGQQGDRAVTAAKINPSGEILWSLDLCEGVNSVYLTYAESDQAGGMFFVWDAPYESIDPGIHIQHVDAEGNEIWEHEGILLNVPNAYNPKMLYDEQHGLYVLWIDGGIVAQRFDENGTSQWAPEGIRLSSDGNTSDRFNLISNSAGGFLCTWNNYMESISKLYGMNILPDGTPANDWWVASQGSLLVENDRNVSGTQVVPFGDGSSLIVWEGVLYGDEEYANDVSKPNYHYYRDLYMQRIAVGQTIEAVEEIPGLTPHSYSLYQNYPNPFNPTTTISFSIAKAGMVSLTVYDLLGRSVTTLMNEHLNSGNYQVPWDASALPSGMYFYRLNAGGFSDVKKTVLLK